MGSGNYFVNIKPVYHSPEDRNIEALARLYDDPGFLAAVIAEVAGPYLPPDQVAGKRVLLKPNWVLHNRKDSDEICMRTHDNLLLALLDHLSAMKPAVVTIGDAPVQGCDWDRTVRGSFLKQVENISRKYNIPVRIRDFRRVTFDPRSNMLVSEKNPLSDYVIFDLGTLSYLEPVSTPRNRFRVTDYDPDRLAVSHGPGVHKYCITRELFEHDVVITVPKVKTHQKAGVTNALKIMVGINGDKDFLPHHRKGGTSGQGDCYPGNNPLLKLSEDILDHANRNRGKNQYKFWRYLSLLFWKFSFPTAEQNLAAGWHGNDTTWRMVLDINRIARFGMADGTISDKPQRTLFSLSDGIVGGQGDGPLQPDPLPLGMIAFSNHSAMTDVAMCCLMGFDFNKIPLLKSAFDNSTNDEVELILDNTLIRNLEALNKYAVKTNPPPGWVNYLT